MNYNNETNKNNSLRIGGCEKLDQQSATIFVVRIRIVINRVVHLSNVHFTSKY